MITVHHLNNSRSQRILWLLEELGLDYQIVRYERSKQTMLAPAALRQIHPLGKSPVISDGDQTLAESGAIIQYLVNKYGNGRFLGTDSTKYLYWMHFAEGSAMGPLLLSLIFRKVQSSTPFFIKPVVTSIVKQVNAILIAPNLKANFQYIEDELSKSEWFAGDEFSAADIQMSFPLEAGAARVYECMGPKSLAYLQKIHERPAYQRALERGGEYSML